MKYVYLFIVMCIGLSTMNAQVGINTTTPAAALDVVGDIKLDSSLFLESPGDNSDIRGSRLLIKATDGSLLEYDINSSKYGPINYVEMVFNDLSTDGLADYDTKISITDYMVAVQGYYFLEAQTGDTNVMLNSTIDDDNIEGHQIYAYQNTTTQTWHVRAFVNNSQFYTRDGSTMSPSSIDMYLNVLMYRRGFISKALSPMTIDMGNLENGTAPLPTGF